MRELTSQELTAIQGGGFFAVATYGIMGFWMGGITGFVIGNSSITVIPAALLGGLMGIYLGLDDEAKAQQIEFSAIE